MFDRDKWLEVIGENADQRQAILDEVDECERDLDMLAEHSENNRVDLRTRTITPEAFTKNENDLNAERDIFANRIAQLTAQLNGPMYRELEMSVAEIEAEYDQFANPRMESYEYEWEIGRSDPTRTRMGLDSEYARDTMRQYLEVFNIRVEIRKDAEPVWHCEGFDDQNRYS